MDLGFDGASMGEIARAAGVSKGTLYVYFADKSRLFEAIVEEEALGYGQVEFNFDPARDVPTTLREFGDTYIALLCRPGGGSAIRTVMAIAERMPDVGRRYYERVLEYTINRLAAYLDARVKVGELRIDDCHLAASQFMLMCQASLFLPFIFQAAHLPHPSASRSSSTARHGCSWPRITRSRVNGGARPSHVIASRSEDSVGWAKRQRAHHPT